VVTHLRWVPQSLMVTQKAEPVTLSKNLLRQFGCIKGRGWQFIITLDESWFYLSTDHEHIWHCPEEQPPERPSHSIQRQIFAGDCIESIGISLARRASKRQNI
jgi:hypothetical protein